MKFLPKTSFYKFNKILPILLMFTLIGEFVAMNPTLHAEEILLDRLVNCTNDIRHEFNKAPLYLNYDLNRAAYKKLQDMDNYDYWSHYNPITGASPWNFMDQTEYEYVHAGENLAFNFYDSEEICETWRNSPTHFENIVNNDYQEVGFAIDQVDLGRNGKGILVVQFFGSREEFVPPTDQRTFYNLSCDYEINSSAHIESPQCIATNETNPEIRLFNSENSVLGIELNNQNLSEITIKEDSYLKAQPSNPLSEGRHKVVARDLEDPRSKAEVHFIVDTIVPIVTANNISIDFADYDGKSSQYSFSVDLSAYKDKYFQEVSFTINNKESNSEVISKKNLQKISNYRYIADLSLSDQNIADQELIAIFTIIDAIGNEIVVQKDFPQNSLNTPVLMKRLSKFPLNFLDFFRYAILILSLIFPVYAIILYYTDKKRFKKIHKNNYGFIFEIAFLSFIILSTYLFFP